MSYFSSLISRVKNNPASLLAGPLNSPVAHWLKLDSLADSVFSPGTAESWINAQTGAGPTGIQKIQMEREDTQYQRGTADLQAAGLNPAMMYNKSVQPAPSSAGGSSSPGSLSDMLELALLPAQIANLHSQAKEHDAAAAKMASDTSLNDQLRLFNEEINPLRIEAQQVSNSLGRTTEKKINAECDKIAEEMKNIAAQTETEATKQLYNLAASALADAQARQIVEMLPYSIELTKAQTSQAKAIARLNFIQAAYQNKLLQEGFVDALIGQQQSNSAMLAVKERIKTGKAFTVDDDSTLAKVWNFFAEASGLSHGVQVIDYILDKINVFAPLVSKTPISSSSNFHDPFGYLSGD